jgi:hypothetical protein
VLPKTRHDSLYIAAEGERTEESQKSRQGCRRYEKRRRKRRFIITTAPRISSVMTPFLAEASATK